MAIIDDDTTSAQLEANLTKTPKSEHEETIAERQRANKISLGQLAIAALALLLTLLGLVFAFGGSPVQDATSSSSECDFESAEVEIVVQGDGNIDFCTSSTSSDSSSVVPDVEAVVVAECDVTMDEVRAEIGAQLEAGVTWPGVGMNCVGATEVSARIQVDGHDVLTSAGDVQRVARCGLADVGVSNELLLADGERVETTAQSRAVLPASSELVEVSLTVFDTFDPLRDADDIRTDGSQSGGWCATESGHVLSFEVALK